MTTPFRTQAGSEELVPGLEVTYDLIICHNDGLVFHDHYISPALRLRMLVQLLTASDVVASAVDATRASEVHEMCRSRSSHWESAPDAVVNAIAKLCRRWGVQVYLSTTKKTTAAPRRLYSVITEYGPGQSVAEHFATRQARRASLIERAETFFDAPDRIPEHALARDERLAALVAMLLTPMTITLTEFALDQTDGVYKPIGPLLPIQ